MFNNVTKTCSGADATWEILSMLAGAFLLGCLLCWLIKKLRGLDTPPGNGNKGHDADLDKKIQDYTSPKKEPQQANQSYKAKKVGVINQAAYATPKIDDLKKISSINENTEALLRDKGIKSYIDLRDADHKTLFEIMDTPDFKVPKQEVETWPHQSSLAAKAEWKKLTEYQNFRSKLQSESKPTHAKAAISRDRQTDDLTKIAGITPKIAKTLNRKGISSYALLRASNKNTLKNHLISGDIKTEKLNTESWLQQAVLAEDGKWDDLEEYQDFLSISDDNLSGLSIAAEKESAPKSGPLSSKESSADKESSTEKKSPTSKEPLADKEPSANKEPSADKESSENKVPSAEKKPSSSKGSPSTNKEPLTGKDSSSVSKINQTHDLKKIEGIGLKIEEVLNKNGIDTFEKLYKANRNTLKSYLDKEGPQFKMHEPESWPHQAGMAYRGEWQKLKEYQDFMIGGPDKAVSLSNSSKLSNIQGLDTNVTGFSKKNSTDDLTRIEGIGPKIQEVLNSHGIKTFEQLSKSKPDTLKLYLGLAGPQFKVHEPESWPRQAGMAHQGEWDNLKKYQDIIIGISDDTLGPGIAEASQDSAAKAVSLSTSYVDDLTKIEGIGPKIEHLLNEAGILNFAQLASAERDTIKSILDKGGPQFKMHEPKTWPKQAGLADNAEWNKLKEYQDELLGGR